MSSFNTICHNCFSEYAAELQQCPYCGYNPMWDMQKYPVALPHGTILAGRYITGRVLGQGGFGITYVAKDTKTGQKVAVKEYFPEYYSTRDTGRHTVRPYSGEPEEQFKYGMKCFIDEAKSLAKFEKNPTVVNICNCFIENGTAYFAMEYVEGINLKTYLKNNGGSISWKKALRLIFPVISAMEWVHKEGIIHRDITPDNIYISKGGNVKILDFGSARYSNSERSCSLDVVLKHGYAPEEQYFRHGKQGPHTDVYSVTATLYAAITGFVPPDALERADCLERTKADKLCSPIQLGIDIPQGVNDVILKGLAIHSKDRYKDMRELREALLKATELKQVDSDKNDMPDKSAEEDKGKFSHIKDKVQTNVKMLADKIGTKACICIGIAALFMIIALIIIILI